VAAQNNSRIRRRGLPSGKPALAVVLYTAWDRNPVFARRTVRIQSAPPRPRPPEPREYSGSHGLPIAEPHNCFGAKMLHAKQRIGSQVEFPPLQALRLQATSSSMHRRSVRAHPCGRGLSPLRLRQCRSAWRPQLLSRGRCFESRVRWAAVAWEND